MRPSLICSSGRRYLTGLQKQKQMNKLHPLQDRFVHVNVKENERLIIIMLRVWEFESSYSASRVRRSRDRKRPWQVGASYFVNFYWLTTFILFLFLCFFGLIYHFKSIIFSPFCHLFIIFPPCFIFTSSVLVFSSFNKKLLLLSYGRADSREIQHLSGEKILHLLKIYMCRRFST